MMMMTMMMHLDIQRRPPIGGPLNEEADLQQAHNPYGAIYGAHFCEYNA